MMRSRVWTWILIGAVILAAEAGAAASTDAGGTLVVLNKSDDTASLIDLATGDVRATLATGHGPHEVAISADGRTAVVGNYGTRGAPGDSLTVIDVARAVEVATIDLGEYQRPHGLAWHPDGRRLLVTAEAQRALLIVDISKASVDRAISTDQEISHMVAVAGHRAFVANIGSGSVSVIDLEAESLEKIIPTGAGAEGITAVGGERQVWVTNRSEDTVSVIDAASLAIVATLECATFPIRAQKTPDGRRVLVSCARSGDVAVFDVGRRTEVRRVAMDLSAADTEDRLFGSRFGDSSVPIGIVVAPDGRRAWVANTNSDVVVELDLGAGSIHRLLRAGKEPDGMGYSAVVGN